MDPIADMLIKIKNAQTASHETVVVPFSKFKMEIAKILEKANLVKSVDKKGKRVRRFIELELAYKDGVPAITGVKKISKPSQRVYVAKDKVRPPKEGRGIAIISTSRGLMTDKEARKAGLGGELIAEVW